MAVTFRDRIAHMKDAIAHIRSLRAEASDTRIRHDPVLRAALERFFEIISEASRHIPEDRRAAYPDIPWKSMRGMRKAQPPAQPPEVPEAPVPSS